MTTETTLNPLARMADERRKTLKLLATLVAKKF